MQFLILVKADWHFFVEYAFGVIYKKTLTQSNKFSLVLFILMFYGINLTISYIIHLKLDLYFLEVWITFSFFLLLFCTRIYNYSNIKNIWFCFWCLFFFFWFLSLGFMAWNV